MSKLTNNQKLELILQDLSNWMDGNEHDGSLEYAFNNGYHLHAASLWASTGAMSEEVEVKTKGLIINNKKELKEVKQLCNEAFIYICKDCNHHAFLEFKEGDSISCMSCGKTAIIDTEKAA